MNEVREAFGAMKKCKAPGYYNGTYVEILQAIKRRGEKNVLKKLRRGKESETLLLE